MRTLLVALCIHGLALGPALADTAAPSSSQPQPKGVSQQLSAAPVIGLPVIAIGIGIVGAVAVAVAVSSSSDDKNSTTSTN
ncbi:hypothetical protein P2H44_23480 [Albimonas sp. CAU 1670]|uniref:hypothetical protein n=1 Tax=Albimonas sp. CAU 1670 TaxID=3032599 RepID=UPI0023DAA8D7|nr:hypothetical protein [Albimonas sp. CAU 1670]MDF2235528.1 hypothetical protein [Albimonas sp. CAU 1670]